MEVVIDVEKFYTRLALLRSKWLSSKTNLFANADALVIPMGATSDVMSYSKAAAIHLYLLGYEFSDSLMVLTKSTFYFMATSKKCGYISDAMASSTLKSEVQIQFLFKTKEKTANEDQFGVILNAIKKMSGSKVGSLLKPECKGEFIPLWNTAVKTSGFETVDIANGLGVFLATKDEVELVKKELLFDPLYIVNGFLLIAY